MPTYLKTGLCIAALAVFVYGISEAYILRYCLPEGCTVTVAAEDMVSAVMVLVLAACAGAYWGLSTAELYWARSEYEPGYKQVYTYQAEYENGEDCNRCKDRKGHVTWRPTDNDKT